MIVYLKLYADLMPPGENGGEQKPYDVPMASTAGELLSYASVPIRSARIILVNGIHSGPDETLKDGDVVSVFPPVAGG